MEDYLPESICRTCLQRGDELTSLHSKDGDTGLTLLDKLRFCASMQVPISERMPSNACALCVRCVTEYYDFKRRCEQSEKTLEELCDEPSEDFVPKIESFLEEDEERDVVTKTEPDDSSCDDALDLTPISEEVDSVTIARDDEVQSESKSKFACETCGKRFTRNFTLKRHHRLMHERRQSKPVSSESSINLNNHFEQTSCNVCGVELKSKEEQSTHVLSCRAKDTGKILTAGQLDALKKKQKYTCDVCSRTVSTIGRLKRHKMLLHSGRQHRCDQCGISFRYACHLRRHMKTHKEGTKYACETCGKEYRSEFRLRVHKAEIHSAEKPVYMCKVCGKTYNFISSLEAHKRTHKPRKRTLNLPGISFKCDICKKTFTTKHDLRNHIRRHVMRKRQCDGCSKVFDSLQKMLEHRTSAHPDLEPYVVKVPANRPSCDLCKKTFCDGTRLRRHLRLHASQQLGSPSIDSIEDTPNHTENANSDPAQHDSEDKNVPPGQLDDLKAKRNHSCNMCSRSYPSLNCLKKHKMLCHSSPPHRCDQCGILYSKAWHLRRHMETHRVVSKYACETCGRAYLFEKSLRLHIAKSHSTEKPIYPCKVCGKTFDLISSLNTHKQIHKRSDVLLKCDICGKSFRTKQEQQEHVCRQQCDGCNNVFDSLPEMLEHRTSSHPDLDPYVDEGKTSTPGQLDDLKDVYNYRCDVCPRSYPSERQLKRHKKLSHSKRQHVCVKCGASYVLPYLLRIHMETHEEGSKHVCEKCSKAFRYTQSLREHMIKYHGGEKPLYECKLCNKTFNDMSSLSAHRQTHNEQKQTRKAPKVDPKKRCDGCDEVFKSLPKMLEHRASAHPGLDPYVVEDKILTPSQVKDLKEKQEYSCDECSRSFATVKYLRSHKTLMHSDRRHRCEHCGILFAQAYHLSRHLKRLHAPGGKMKFICEKCGKEYSFEDSLRLHIEEKHAAEKPIYTCKVCGKTYNCKASINTHKFTHEPRNYRFQCELCGGGFLTKARLVRHVKYTHNKQHSCDMCDKRFGLEVELLKHKATHVSDMAKPYPCTLCEKRFSTTSAVAFHMSTLHHGKKHLKCDVCGMEFYNRFHYAAHYSSHTGIKPYRCDGCGLGYNYNRDMMKHRKTCASLLELARQ